MDTEPIRVFICDDQWIVCEGLEAILDSAEGILVVGTAHDGQEALNKIAAARPDVVLMDLKMPGMNGIQATQRIREQHPSIKVLVLTTYAEEEWVLDAVRSGAAGYLLKGTPKSALIEAIRGTALGQTHIDPAVAGALFEHVAHRNVPQDIPFIELLSERELDVLRLIARGLSNSDIARRLFLSDGTVRNYVSSILSKLDVSDRTQAAVLALRAGLVDLGEI